jgi:RNA polymerase sigma-70 factor, ECF subfamily
MVRASDASLQDRHTAFTGLVERFQSQAIGLAISILRDIDEAMDAAQDAFMTAWLRLHQLRDASAFSAWLKSIVVTECHRRLRRPSRLHAVVDLPEKVHPDTAALDYQSLVASGIAALSTRERDVTVLHYALGYTYPEIARLLGLKIGTVAKRLHAARLRMRRFLPPSVRKDFVPVSPSKNFLDEVGRGIFDEHVGEYRFVKRPDLIVRIQRIGPNLVSDGAGQRNVLASLTNGALVTANYDGEGRFGRNRKGKITHFTYYEFGRRLGVARKVE